MFIYSKYSSHGVEEPEKLVNLLANDGVRAICLIDEFGLGIVPFLKTCKRRRINASVAIPFNSYVEGYSEKQSGYLVAPSSGSYEMAKYIIEKTHKEFISLLKRETVKELAENDVYCMIRNGDDCYEYFLKTKIKVLPVAYESQYIRTVNMHKAATIKGVSLEDNYFFPETVIFVEGVSRSSATFLNEHENKNRCVDIRMYKEQRASLDSALEMQVK